MGSIWSQDLIEDNKEEENLEEKGALISSSNNGYEGSLVTCHFKGLRSRSPISAAAVKKCIMYSEQIKNSDILFKKYIRNSISTAS